MYKLIATTSVAALLLGLAPNVYAQSVSGAASLRSVEARSFRLETTPRRATGEVQPGQVVSTTEIGSSNPADRQFVYERLSNEAALVVGPSKEDRELFDVTSAGVSGNNRVQVLFSPNP